ncbi:MAG: homoserine O-succinyltransferase, partial [Ruminococcus sp.]
SSEISGVHIVANKNGRQYFITGHSEYDRETIANEYFRDLEKGLDIKIPYNYFPDDDPTKTPEFSWRCTANLMFSNWLNYCVYQLTPFDLGELDIRNWNWQAGF